MALSLRHAGCLLAAIFLVLTCSHAYSAEDVGNPPPTYTGEPLTGLQPPQSKSVSGNVGEEASTCAAAAQSRNAITYTCFTSPQEPPYEQYFSGSVRYCSTDPAPYLAYYEGTLWCLPVPATPPDCPAGSFTVPGMAYIVQCIAGCVYEPSSWAPDESSTTFSSTGATCNDEGDGGDGGDPNDPGDGGDGGDGGDPGDGGDGGGDGDGGDGSGDGDGSGGGTGDGTGGDGDCDPQLEECGDSEYGGGTCTEEQRSPPECYSELDAVQCAIFINNWNHLCDDELRYQESIGTDEYRESESVLDDNETNEVQEEEIDLADSITLDDSGGGYGGSASCPADISMSIPPFGTVVLPFYFICDWASMIRPMVIALGWLIAGFIVFRNFVGE